MSWLRLDDGFSIHPKIVSLSVADRWTWVEVLIYCARYRTGGTIPRGIAAAIPRAGTAFLRRAAAAGLIDEYDDGALEVHDWQTYNGPIEAAALAKKRYRMRNAGIDEAIVREVAPYADDDIVFEADSAQAKGLAPLGDILRDVAGDVPRDTSGDIRFTRAVSPTPTPRDTQPLTEQQLVHAREKRARTGYVDNLAQYTGARIVRGEVGITHVYDPLGTEPVPADWPHSRPTREEIIRAFRERGE